MLQGDVMLNCACPHCSKTMPLSADLAGKRVRCPGCKKPFDAPDMLDRSAPAFAGLGKSEGIDEEDGLDTRPERNVNGKHRGEPWFYAYLETTAHILIALGLIFFVYELVDIAVAARTEGRFIITLIYLVATLVLTFLLPCGILLAVDMGRSLRAMRDND
jgi:hypothetical protein